MLACLQRGRDDDEYSEDDDVSGKCFSRPSKEVPTQLVPTAPAPHAPAPTVIVAANGVRRDRSAAFRRLRSDRSPRLAMRSRRAETPSFLALGAPETKESGCNDAEVTGIFEEASQIRSSLASKLAQHSGMLQFSTEFRDRAPILELRLLLPGLELAIEQLLGRLLVLCDALRASSAAAADAEPRALSAPTSAAVAFESGSGARADRLRSALEASFRQSCEEAREVFAKQRQELRAAATASPLHSPLICPKVGERLAAAIGSPAPSSTSASASASARLNFGTSSSCAITAGAASGSCGGAWASPPLRSPWSDGLAEGPSQRRWLLEEAMPLSEDEDDFVMCEAVAPADGLDQKKSSAGAAEGREGPAAQAAGLRTAFSGLFAVTLQADEVGEMEP
eukprot:TRINITY_DN25701_c0_g5_i1.p1 TRINITY_DN25701_c0_g5~~TRINITY_DN25701_c0_g5_i1.p1  ORF type:complete len:395 (-),score=109.97 TRINITY_DN25701_c0_g5_i1:137-1321(-)